MIGHAQARAYLERELPQATLLHGPASIGKWTLAQHLADHHQVSSYDRWTVEYGFSMETVRLVTAYAARAPHGPFKLVVARLDDSGNKALNALLKTLEEPPPRVKFLLTSSGRTLPTVASRCMVFELGELTRPELAALYREKGLPAAKADRAAAYARGSVNRGYEADKADQHHSQIVTLAKALSTGDRELYHTCFTGWDLRSSEILTVFLTECLTHRWVSFTEADTFGLHHDRPRLWRMVSALSRLSAARPRLNVRSALEPFLAR